MFALSSFYWRECLKCLFSTSSPTITRGLSVNGLLTLIIVKVPTHRRSLRFGSVLLRQSSSSFQALPTPRGFLSLGFFIFLLFLSAALLKIWCRQSKVNRRFNLFSPCQETLSCEITEQELRLGSRFGNSHGTSRLPWQQPQLSHWQRPLWAPEDKHGDKTPQSSLTWQKKPLHRLRKGLLKAQLVSWLWSWRLVLPPFESVLEDHSRTVMSPPGSLLLRPRGGKKEAGLAAFGGDNPHGYFSGEEETRQPVCRLEQLITSSQTDLLCFRWVSSTREACRLHPPKSSDKRLLWFMTGVGPSTKKV